MPNEATEHDQRNVSFPHGTGTATEHAHTKDSVPIMSTATEHAHTMEQAPALPQSMAPALPQSMIACTGKAPRAHNRHPTAIPVDTVVKNERPCHERAST